jgi:glycosyltransferase involved in cell wall biosynthesis
MSIAKEPVYIIIPVHNRKVVTLKCLETLKTNGDLERYYTVVVDDGSTDGTSETIMEKYPDVIILYGDGNLWWTGAIKLGMEYAYEQGAQYFIWLNDDCIVPLQTIGNLVAYSYQHPKSIVGTQGYHLESPNTISFGGYLTRNSLSELLTKSLVISQDCRTFSPKPYDILNGNLVCLPREIIHAVGFPNPKQCLHYFGDFIYTAKAKQKGFHLIVQDFGNVYDRCLNKSYAYFKKWMFIKGEPLLPLKSIFLMPQSIIYYKVNFLYFKVLYGLPKGLVYFTTYYIFRIFFPIIVISFLRFFPLTYRKKISQLKNKLFKFQGTP